MKPKQGKNNARSNNNKRGHKQQQQQQQGDQQQQTNKNVTDDVIRSNDVSVTSSAAVECPDAENIPSKNNSNDNFHHHSPEGASDHDVEVTDILHSAVTFDPEVTEVTTGRDPHPDMGQFTAGSTELIMAKTFTESTHPGREFVPIRRGTVDDDVINPVAGSLTVRCELVNPALPTKMASETTSGFGDAVGQVRDLTSEFRHLQSLLDELGTSCSSGAVETSDSSEEDLGQDWDQQARVVYHYHLRDGGNGPLSSTSKRWICRVPPEELNTQHQENVVPRQEREEKSRTEAEELMTPAVEEDRKLGRSVGQGDLKTQGHELVVPRHETHLERGNLTEEQLGTEQEESTSTTSAVPEDKELGQTVALPDHEAQLEKGDQSGEGLRTQHQDLVVVEDASFQTGDVVSSTENCRQSSTAS